MRKSLLFAALALACVRAHGEGWSIGAGTGPFIFGGFAERSITIMNEGGTGTTRSRLSAATRPGAVVDLERDLGDRFAFGIQGTWTEAPLRIKSATGNQGVTLDAGHVRVTTFVAPVVLRINPRGTFRFHLLAGPAYAIYNVRRRAAGGVTAPLFDGTRGRWGGAAGAGVGWWWRPRFAVEWQVEDIVTSSPFRATDIAPSGQKVHIPKPQNGHTSVGIRYRF